MTIYSFYSNEPQLYRVFYSERELNPFVHIIQCDTIKHICDLIFSILSTNRGHKVVGTDIPGLHLNYEDIFDFSDWKIHYDSLENSNTLDELLDYYFTICEKEINNYTLVQFFLVDSYSSLRLEFWIKITDCDYFKEYIFHNMKIFMKKCLKECFDGNAASPGELRSP